MSDGNKDEADAAPGRLGHHARPPRDRVSPLDLAGGLRAPTLSDDELDELCTIEIAELSRPRANDAG